jgi:aquaporin Z
VSDAAFGHAGRRFGGEALGTFFLVLIGPGAVMVDARSGGALGPVGISLAFGFAVLAMVYAFGPISGAHINPAVTLAFWSVGRFPRRDVPLYIVAQCAGAIGAAFVLRAVLGPVGHLGATIPAIGWRGAFVFEFLLSAALMLVIVAVATDDRVAVGFAPVAIGLTVAFCALVGGSITGASMNPARSLGPAVAGGQWQSHWLYWLAPAAGMLLAAQLYVRLRGLEPPDRTVAVGLEGPLP